MIFLHMPVEVSRKLISSRKLDIHERDLEYLERVVDVYESLANGRENWVKVECVKGNKLLKPEEIRQKVLEALKQRKILFE